MPHLVAKGSTYPVDLLVFDKDGLMFESQQFWKELGNCRLRLLAEVLPVDFCTKWARVFGIALKNGKVKYVDPKGAFATASPREEIAVTAGLIIDSLNWTWVDARQLAERVFTKADEELNLKKALVPRDGFIEIFQRIDKAGIPFAVATSDTRDRVTQSFRLFGLKPPRADMILTPEDVKQGKPSPEMLFTIAKRASVHVRRIAMVGDSYVDVQMANTAGAVGIGIPETEEMLNRMRPFASEIVTSLNDITVLKD